MSAIPPFREMQIPRPALDDVSAQYRDLNARLDAARTDDERTAAVLAWDALRKHLDTWRALTQLHYNQNTRNDEARKEREYCDEIQPRLTEHAVAFKRRLLGSPERAFVEARFGTQCLALWESDVAAFDPVIAEDCVAESRLEAEYNDMLAQAKIPFRGQTENLSTIRRFLLERDRDSRREAQTVLWGWYLEHAEPLDRIYDDLVRLRTAMGRKMGFPDYTGLGYRRMNRIDYGEKDVARYRDEVLASLVPVCSEIRREQAKILGIDRVMYWDEGLHDPAGAPGPLGDHAWMLGRAAEMFDAMHPELGSFFRMMIDRGLLDLKARDGKSGGGFCTSFPDWGVPFIFANFNGSKGDVEVFTHECGHAFQGWKSRDKQLSDYNWPTMESAEIHSMSLEFLALPWIDRFFGADGARRFRRVHVTDSVTFIPYGVAIDHFQHRVYAEPEATPAARRAMWKEMEARYLPDREWGDLRWPSDGGAWQAQRHVYLSPFYYIDYTLAQACAFQFWVRAEGDRAAAMRDYVALCARGGEAPFQGLVRSAGLRSPFEAGSLAGVASTVRTELGLVAPA